MRVSRVSNRQLQMLAAAQHGPSLRSIAHHHLRTWRSLVDANWIRLSGDRVYLSAEGRDLLDAFTKRHRVAELLVKRFSPTRVGEFRAASWPLDVAERRAA